MVLVRKALDIQPLADSTKLWLHSEAAAQSTVTGKCSAGIWLSLAKLLCRHACKTAKGCLANTLVILIKDCSLLNMLRGSAPLEVPTGVTKAFSRCSNNLGSSEAAMDFFSSPHLWHSVPGKCRVTESSMWDTKSGFSPGC